jgi:hypothetical protein
MWLIVFVLDFGLLLGPRTAKKNWIYLNL